jgi:hypothetical protein
MIESAVQQLPGAVLTTSSVTVNGTGGQLDLNGKTLRLTGTNKGFLTQNGGTLKMVWASPGLVDTGFMLLS